MFKKPYNNTQYKSQIRPSGFIKIDDLCAPTIGIMGAECGGLGLIPGRIDLVNDFPKLCLVFKVCHPRAFCPSGAHSTG